MGVMVIGKIESGQLKILNIKCGPCGAMFSIKDFENEIILCSECMKKWRKK